MTLRVVMRGMALSDLSYILTQQCKTLPESSLRDAGRI